MGFLSAAVEEAEAVAEALSNGDEEYTLDGDTYDIADFGLETTEFNGFEAILITLDNPSTFLVFHGDDEASIEYGDSEREYLSSGDAEVLYSHFF